MFVAQQNSLFHMFLFARTLYRTFLLGGVYFLIAAGATGCLTAKKLTYFQNNIPALDTLLKPAAIAPGSGDILYIQVNSLGSIDNAVQNPFPPIPADPQAPPPANAVGYRIDREGIVSLPLAGSIAVAGKTTEQIEDSIRIKLQSYLKTPSVIVRLANLRITVLGEVNKPATFTLNYYTLTLPQALGLAGDLTAYARRNNVLIIRQAGRAADERRTYARLDLTQSSVLNSPYYYLQPNDVVYVAPTNARAASIDRTYQILPIVLTGVSVLATLLSITLK